MEAHLLYHLGPKLKISTSTKKHNDFQKTHQDWDHKDKSKEMMCGHYLPCAHSKSMVALPQAPALGTKLWLSSHLADLKVPIRGIAYMSSKNTQNHSLLGYI